MMDLSYIIHRSQDIFRDHGIRSLYHSGIRFVEANTVGTDRYYWTKYRSRKWIQSRKYGPVPHAFELAEVDPAEIEYVSRTSPADKWRLAGTVAGGDWDQSKKRFDQMDLHQAFKHRFVDNVAWDETEFYERVVNEIHSGKTKWGCRSVSEFNDRCESIDALFDSIRDHGYMSQRGIARSQDSIPQTNDHTLTGNSALAKYDEIAIDIGRNGEFLFVDGRNRLSICKILGIDSIPVRVVRRHRDWQAFRLANNREDVSRSHIDT